VFLRLQTDSGEVLWRRLVPAVAADGFLLNPLVESTADFVGLYGPSPGRRVTSLRVVGGGADFRNEIEVTVRAADRLACRTLGEVEVARLAYPGMSPGPTAAHSDHPMYADVVDGRVVCVLRAEGVLRFRVPEGAGAVAAEFGVAPQAAWACDGVLFRVEHEAEGGKRAVLFERHLDPRANAADRGVVPLELRLPPDCRGELLFRTTNRRGEAPGLWDLAFWSGVTIR
jgi:hypothetical protein